VADSLHDPRYERLIKLVVGARKKAGLSQRDVAAALKQPHSYIGKVESLQRRLDLIELIDLLDAIGVKPSLFLSEAIRELKAR
jgi:transcriptional regulator with XRE-family HTH domain